MADELILDDFSVPDMVSTIGTRWECFTDQVMGGRSEMRTGFFRESEQVYLRMEGDLSLENNGGFIQVRLPFNENNDPFNASNYKGIRIRYRTAGTSDSGVEFSMNKKGGYYLHLRTTGNRLPWAHYSAKIQASAEWTTASVPWNSFVGQYTLLGDMNTRKLKSVAVVAGLADFSAEIDVAYIGLY